MGRNPGLVDERYQKLHGGSWNCWDVSDGSVGLWCRETQSSAKKLQGQDSSGPAPAGQGEASSGSRAPKQTGTGPSFSEVDVNKVPLMSRGSPHRRRKKKKEEERRRMKKNEEE
ncbi:hypothetical protein HGM15179_018287 [Zosterops borbonicus]|uniref:Uncharacterized protein n=1 Tax=Zosterops borbonicus TaxID=364589 RepID=A0A8K1LCF5_9PASS|nr:hypothetical protein HGM15179_018287 [Zosterops borbonicus]